MNAISDNLKQSYETFREKQDPYDFFVGLADYVNHILEMSVLKGLVDKVMKEKDIEYEKLTQLEEKTLRELIEAKNKLLKVIEDCSIDPNLLQHIKSVRFSDSVLDTLEQFEKEQISITGFRGHSLEDYLFDIAVGICKQGHQDSIKEFIDPGRKSNNVYSDFSFSFSNTLGLWEKQIKLIDSSKKLQLWGAFDHVLEFQKAYAEVSKNTHYTDVLSKYSNRSRNYLEGRDAVDITFTSQDLETIMNQKYGRVLDKSIHYLKMTNFKLYASRINEYLSKELSKIETEGTKRRKLSTSTLYLNIVGDLWQEPKGNSYYPMGQESSRCKIVRYLATHEGFQKPKNIRPESGNNSDQSVRTEIGKINEKFRKFLKAKDKLIIGKKGSGYKINPKYRIIRKDS